MPSFIGMNSGDSPGSDTVMDSRVSTSRAVGMDRGTCVASFLFVGGGLCSQCYRHSQGRFYRQ
jgi:hypothetical protein